MSAPRDEERAGAGGEGAAGPPAAKLGEAAAERFLRYVRIDTQSDPSSPSYPSTEKQFDLLRLLLRELKELGLSDPGIDEYGYVTALLPPTVPGVATIAFFAHVDTSPDVTGAEVNPLRRRYDGGDIVLGSSGQLIAPADSPALAGCLGHDVITSDGTTLLGADDKAGIAEIMAAIAYLIAHPEIPHGPVKVVFNPDEEIARGVEHFSVDAFDATAAYTLDGSTAGEIQDETFSAAQVTMRIRGRAIHPGWAKGELVNAIKLAARIVERLPPDRLSPETTDGREGYIHPLAAEGNAGAFELRFLVRDFDADLLEEKIAYLKGIADEVATSDFRASVEVESVLQYRNMRDSLSRKPEVVARLERAIRRVGLEPRRVPFRGGTDGAVLTELGLPTPNIFAGWQNAHSEREWVCVKDMGLASATIVELARIWAEDSGAQN